MIFKDYYKILELDTNKATIEQIKTNYRDLAKRYHPDVNIGDKVKEERFKDINEAYRVLSDSTSRKKYDRMWNSNIGKKKYEESRRSSDSAFSDFFHMFFGNIEKVQTETGEMKKDKKVPVKGDNIETQMEVSIEEAFYGKEKKLSLRTIDGKMRTFTIKIPAGIRNNEKIRLIGQGKAGQNGGKNGDLFIKIHIEDSKIFKLNGCDIVTDLCLTPWEAALGARVTINTMEDTASVYVPQGIESGEKIRIPSKGYKDGKGGRGDLVAQVKIVVPKMLTEQERELFESLHEVSKFQPRKQDIL